MPLELCLPMAAVLVPSMVAGTRLDLPVLVPHQPSDPMSSGLSCTLQWVHAGGAAVSLPPAPMSHCQGWSHLGTVTRAATSSPSRGTSSLMVPRGCCFTSPCFCHAKGDKPSGGASPVHTVWPQRGPCVLSLWGSLCGHGCIPLPCIPRDLQRQN